MIIALSLATAPVTAESCGNLPQQPMNRCFARLFEQTDAELNRQWQITSDALKARDRDFKTSADRQPGYFETLLASQRAWLIYRDKHCLGASFAARGGTLAPTLLSSCKVDMTRARIGELKELVGYDN